MIYLAIDVLIFSLTFQIPHLLSQRKVHNLSLLWILLYFVSQ